MESVDNKVVIGSLFGIGIAALGGAAIYHHLQSRSYSELEASSKPALERSIEQLRHIKAVALLGDVGGTNLRFRLVELSGCSYADLKEIKSEKLKVSEYVQFHHAVEHFLRGTGVHPSICVIAIAGPVDNNSILMSNVQRWGVLDGKYLGIELKINRFVFINDFEANAYGLMSLNSDDFVKLNGLDPIDTQHKLIIGPGTGLGTASLIAVPTVSGKNQNFVAPGEGGHIGFAPSNSEQEEYYVFLKRHLVQPVVVLEAVFCGPAIPYMFKFFSQKFPEMEGAHSMPTAEEIIRIGVEHPQSLHRKAVKLLLDIYQNVVGDEILTKLCYGGLYLQGSITQSVLPLLQDKSIGWLGSYKEKRPYLQHVFDRVPIVVIKVPDLGMRGSFIYARKQVV